MNLVDEYYIVFDYEECSALSSVSKLEFEGYIDDDDYPILAEQFPTLEAAKAARAEVYELIEMDVDAFIEAKPNVYSYSRKNFKILKCKVYEKIVEVYHRELVDEDEDV